MIIWKKKPPNLKNNKLIKAFNILISKIVWSVEIIQKVKSERIMLFSKCPECNSENSKFIKEHGASGLLGSLGIKTLLSKIHLVSPL